MIEMMVFSNPFSNSTVPHLFVSTSIFPQKPLRLQEATKTGSGGGANTSEVDRSNKRAATGNPHRFSFPLGYAARLRPVTASVALFKVLLYSSLYLWS